MAALPKDFELTTEQTEVLYADKIERAKRFHTEHLLPKSIKKAEFESKRVERMKRFKNENGDANADETVERGDIVASNKELSEKDNLALMERKLRFGTTMDRSLDDMSKDMIGKKGNYKGKKKGFNPKNKQRQFKNKQKFKSYREYNKRSRGGGSRGRGRGGRRGGRGGGYKSYNNRNNNNAQFSAEDQALINSRKARFN